MAETRTGPPAATVGNRRVRSAAAGIGVLAANITGLMASADHTTTSRPATSPPATPPLSAEGRAATGAGSGWNMAVTSMLAVALALLGVHAVLALADQAYLLASLAVLAWSMTAAVLVLRVLRRHPARTVTQQKTLRLQSRSASDGPNPTPPQLSADGIGVELRFDRPMPQEIAQELLGDLARHLQNWQPHRSNDPRIADGMIDMRLQARLQVLEHPRR